MNLRPIHVKPMSSSQIIPKTYQVSSLLYNSKQHEMRVQHFKYFSIAVTVQLENRQWFCFRGFNSISGV